MRELRRALGELLSSADKERLLAAPPPPPDELAATAARLAATPAFASLQQTLEAEIEQAVAEALHRLENDEELWPEDGRSSFGSISWARALSLSGGGGGGRDGSQRAAAASAGSGSLRSGRLDDDFGEPFSMFLGPAQQTQRLVARLGRDTALHHRLEVGLRLPRQHPITFFFRGSLRPFFSQFPGCGRAQPHGQLRAPRQRALARHPGSSQVGALFLS